MAITRISSRPGGGSLTSLNERSREIFRQIVDSYLAHGEAVGSRHVARLLPIALSPASVRNVMQDLEELGLIYAPHTSAGRLPTELGLRFFVDAMLELGDIAPGEREHIEAQLKAAAQEQPLEAVLGDAMSMLSGLTRGAGVVVTTGDNLPGWKQIEFRFRHRTRARAGYSRIRGWFGRRNRILGVFWALRCPASALGSSCRYFQRPHPRAHLVRGQNRDRGLASGGGE